MHRQAEARPDNDFFRSLCHDMLSPELGTAGSPNFEQIDRMVEEVYRALQRPTRKPIQPRNQPNGS